MSKVWEKDNPMQEEVKREFNAPPMRKQASTMYTQGGRGSFAGPSKHDLDAKEKMKCPCEHRLSPAEWAASLIVPLIPLMPPPLPVAL